MKKIVALILCVLVVISLGGCSSDYDKTSRKDFHNDFVLNIRESAECTQLCNEKNILGIGYDCYAYKYNDEEIKIFVDKMASSWEELPFEESIKTQIYDKKNDDGMNIASAGNIPLSVRGYWCAKTEAGMVHSFDINKNYSLAILDTERGYLYYFRYKKSLF